jgi:hypothetical protein
MTNVLSLDRETDVKNKEVVENKYEFVNYIGLSYEISKLFSDARNED